MAPGVYALHTKQQGMNNTNYCSLLQNYTSLPPRYVSTLLHSHSSPPQLYFLSNLQSAEVTLWTFVTGDVRFYIAHKKKNQFHMALSCPNVDWDISVYVNKILLVSISFPFCNILEAINTML